MKANLCKAKANPASLVTTSSRPALCHSNRGGGRSNESRPEGKPKFVDASSESLTKSGVRSPFGNDTLRIGGLKAFDHGIPSTDILSSRTTRTTASCKWK